jgi:hypothetical protein
MTGGKQPQGGDPIQVLGALRGKLSDRKQRLFACACCRSICALLLKEPRWPSMPQRRLLLAHERLVVLEAGQYLEVAEQFADGLATLAQVRSACSAVSDLLAERQPIQEPWTSGFLPALRTLFEQGSSQGRGRQAQGKDAARCARVAVDHARRVASWAGMLDDQLAAFRQCLADLLQDCVCGPHVFQGLPPTLDPTILHWQNGTVLQLAQAVYDQRRFQDLPILADALEEAGCEDADILNHCRQPGEHMRGCWVLDLVLGRA